MWWYVVKSKYFLKALAGMEQCDGMRDLSPMGSAIYSIQRNEWWCDLFSGKCFTWEVRNGNTVFFWENAWIMQEPLAKVYPRL